jgi:hypothetical protein
LDEHGRTHGVEVPNVMGDELEVGNVLPGVQIGVRGRPYAHRVLGNGVEGPDQVAGLCAIGLDEAANAILAAVGANENLAVDGGRGHRFAIALLWIGDLLLPYD